MPNISIRELNNDLMAKAPLGLKEDLDQEGNCLISDTSLNSLIPPNVKKNVKQVQNDVWMWDMYLGKGYAKRFECIHVIIAKKIWE